MAAILEMRGISKVFPGVKALSGVDYTVEKGEISALLGENGAGKSTLIKIISGVYAPSAGEILLDGKPQAINSASEAQRLGIGTIHQEFNLFPNLTVLENIAFCSQLNSFSCKLLRWKSIRKKAAEVLASMRVEIPLDSKVKYLTVAQQQLVEIAKSLMLNIKILIMDEPTAALTQREIQDLFVVIRSLRDHGVSIIYISHHLGEVMELADCATILRDGQKICAKPVAELTEKEITQMITGKTEYLSTLEKRRTAKEFGEVRLEVRDLALRAKYRNIRFQVRRGEIYGILGPLGAGKTEIGATLYGVFHPDQGEILLDGKPVSLRSPDSALRRKIAYISEDRKGTGNLTGMSVRQNLSISTLLLECKSGIINRKLQGKIIAEYIGALRIKTPSDTQSINFLSGGNQQKVLIGRSLATNPQVLILDQPTRGLDIGAKDEIRKLLSQLADGGMSILVLTMEAAEAMELCDTIAVLKEGRITAVTTPAQSSVQELTEKMLSGDVEVKQ